MVAAQKRKERSGKPLSDRAQAFVREYCVCLDATKAARAAGYAEGTAQSAGSRLLADPRVQDLVSQHKRAADDDAGSRKREIVDGLLAIWRTDPRQAMRWGTEKREVLIQPSVRDLAEDPDAEPRKETVEHVFAFPLNSADLTPEVAFSISEVKLTKAGFSIKFHDKNAAADKLMRHLGMYAEDNAQQADGLARLIAAAQGTPLPVSTDDEGGDDE